MTNKDKVIIYTDGGARGNPGPAAIGVSFPDFEKHYGEEIGVTTNNVAEYTAIIFALKKAKQLLGSGACKSSVVEIRSDSELVIKQMNGMYKVKDEDMKPLFIEVWNLKQDFRDVIFTHIVREKNKVADGLVNRALDARLV
jgi:ribonuclease HI